MTKLNENKEKDFFIGLIIALPVSVVLWFAIIFSIKSLWEIV